MEPVVFFISIALFLVETEMLLCAELDPMSDEFINAINEKQSLWKADRNFRKDISSKFLKRLSGLRTSNSRIVLPELKHNLADVKIPDNFDWRDHFPNCPSLKHIRDQGSCGSCWAVSTVAAISDRICIHSKGSKDVYISDSNLLSCCDSCGDGCDGGYEVAAFDYWKIIGIVSGGPYNSSQGCRPYEVPPCEHHVNGSRPSCDSMDIKTPACNRKCIDGYPKCYEDDLHLASEVYTIDNDPRQIQAEIMTNGPVVAGFVVYEDFLHYKSGIYKHVLGDEAGGHAVKIIGWGIENDIPYWLIANSWNTDWGDNGYFKFIRGENHCGMEARISAGIPA